MTRFVNSPGLDSIITRLSQISDAGHNLLPLLKEIGDDETARTIRRFEEAKAPDGTSWAALKQPRKRGGDLPLSDTGRLKGSITSQILGDNVVTIGSRVDYAPYHQFGTAHIPARPFLGVSDDLMRTIEDFIHDHFDL